MTINFFTQCLECIALVVSEFPPLLWIFCCACICSVAYIIKSIINLRG